MEYKNTAELEAKAIENIRRNLKYVPGKEGTDFNFFNAKERAIKEARELGNNDLVNSILLINKREQIA